MADKKISELDAITGAATAADDFFIVVDTSGSATKKISRAELNNAIEQDVLAQVDITSANIDGGTIDNTPIGATTPSTGDFTTVDTTGDVTVGGNLTVNGTTTTVNSTTLDVDDINITVASGAADAAAADGAGLTVDGASATFNYASSGDKWTMNKPLDVTGTITFDGGTTSADLNFGDNDKAIFGAGSDLQIYHDPATGHSIINELGAGSLQLRGTSIQLKNADNTKNYIAMTDGGDVDLYHNNSVKLSTTATGVDVTGTITSNGLTVDTNTLYVDSTNDRIGIRTSSPQTALVISNNGAEGIEIDGYNVSAAAALIQAYNRSTSAFIPLELRASQLEFNIVGSEAARFDSSQNFLVGTTGTLSMGSSTTAGFQVGGDFRGVKTDGNPIMYLKHQSNDGKFINFYKDTSSVGSIGTNNGIPYFLRTSGGIAIGNTSLLSANSSGAINDDASDLGASSNRWKNLYLSGSVRNPSGALTFDTNGSERLRIDSSGNLLVGCTSLPSSSVAGAGFDASNASELKCSVGGTGNSTQIRFLNPNGEVGAIRTSGTATSYVTSSDYRLKENVTADWDATTRLKQLNPVRFNFIADADTTVDGFLAHEVQSVVPEAISGTHNEVDDDGNPVYQGIDQSKLVPLLVKTIQELEARIAALEAN